MLIHMANIPNCQEADERFELLAMPIISMESCNHETNYR